MQDDEYATPFPCGSTWEACYRDFLRHHHNPKTRQSYHYFLCQFFGVVEKAPDRIMRADVERYLNQPGLRSGQPPSISTRNQRMTALNSFYRYVADYSLEDEQGEPVPLLARPRPTIGFQYIAPEIAYRAMSEDEVRRFFAAIPRDTVKGMRDRTIFLFFFWTARRREEIAGLRWGDLEYGTIVEETGKRRPGWVYHFRGKGRKHLDDRAELPLPAKTALDDYLQASGRAATIKASDGLFVSTQQVGATQGLHGGHFNTLMKHYTEQAGIARKGLSLHSWRHTSTQLRYAAGEDIRSLQRHLRHSSLAVTDRYVRGLLATADNGAQLLLEQFGGL